MPEITLDQALEAAVEHHQAGRLSEAESLYRQILAVAPDHPDALHLLGLLAHQAGHLEPAIQLIGRAIELDDSVADYHSNLGTVYQADGRLDEAIAAMRRAVELNPDHPDALNNLGAALTEKGLTTEAIVNLKRAVELRPDSPDAQTNLGAALREAGRVEEAAACHRRALGLRPDHPQVYINLGAALHHQEQLDEAIAAYSRALELQPNSPQAHNNIGTALSDFGRPLEAIESFQRAIDMKPNYAHAHWNLGLAYLRVGDFARGWPECEWRWKVPRFPTPKRNFTQPQWDGSNPAGKTILVHGEQGFGDVIQFVRYVPLLVQRGATVYVEVRNELFRLLATLGGAKSIFATGDRLPTFDLQIPVMSLPLAFGTTLATIPAPNAYLTAHAASARLWRDRVGTEGLRVGLVWSGSPTHRNDPIRSILFATTAPLGRIPGVKLFSLQKGDAAAQARTPPAGMGILDHMPEVSDFSDTAALIHNLHLVITIDSAVAHLAGALGKPVWLMLPHSAEWRWFQEREDSPWYPTMRLFRQPTRGDWLRVIDRVAERLTAVAAGQELL
jgi:tetratricopeptide (TPR) repeat protein